MKNFDGTVKTKKNNFDKLIGIRFRKKYSVGFTLVEVLVVVAILGLLVSIVMVGLKGTSKKADVAKSKSLSQSIKNAVGSELIAEWAFDNNDLLDSSGQGRPFTMTPPAAWSIVDGGVSGKAYQLLGTTGSISSEYPFPTYPPYSKQLFSGSGFTYEAWVYPTSLSNDLTFGMLESDEVVRLRYGTYAPQTWDFIIWSTAPSYFCRVTKDIPISSVFVLNEWNHVTASYNQDGKMKVYINGELFMENNCEPGTINTTTARNGFILLSTTGAVTGKFDGLRIYNSSF